MKNEIKDPRHWKDIDPEKRYRLDEVTVVLNCSESMVYKLRSLGQLKWVKVGSHHRYPGWTLIEYLREAANED